MRRKDPPCSMDWTGTESLKTEYLNPDQFLTIFINQKGFKKKVNG